ncbi:MAG: DUF4202 domain-containing protein [Paracoccus sp. (in: a-proteobacteria)]|uniref:DUF4202 domain-containing protein n=1 Tax=Paracoccus sp. TaxID=267 RepID=UPI0026DEA7DD|nr:DUF4202 domain-containing protein [Paracoccus sp. (in: a-proteobacteria)]MDO5622021.1 DUF4202 domain-containing protein [Paracoccus sp. (in: a-proteobacteria)]
MTQTRLQTAFAAIDHANAADPRTEAGEPVELLYGRRMTAEQRQLFPDAPDTLAIACRGQHIERWTLPRDAYPDGREGYLTWRRDQGRRHAEQVHQIMLDAGYPQAEADHTAQMLRKEGIKRDPLVQALEDVACFTFIRHYLSDFATTQDPDKLLRIVQKTARKMSAEARIKALETFPMPDAFAAAFRD